MAKLIPALSSVTSRAMDRLLLTHHGDSRFVAEVSEALAP